ncbi:uncharacterized protein LOC141850263 isoform X2 [Brevipalpus obovatus]|uniref:uncharacterized protein LOC141850263 isoform X2 n=1 Tax=Brevipalpus obovatus TaxID=246614 RepID=UPI003D9EBFD1
MKDSIQPHQTIRTYHLHLQLILILFKHQLFRTRYWSRIFGAQTGGFRYDKFKRFYKKFFANNFGPVSDFYVGHNHISWDIADAAIVTFEDPSSVQKALNASKKQLTVDLKRIRRKHPRSLGVLEISPIEETLVSRARRYVETRNETNNKETKELEDNFAKLVSGEIKRGPCPKKKQDQNFIQDGIQKLNVDVMRKIIEELEDIKDLISCGLVCRRWNAITEGIWYSKKKLTIGNLYTTPIDHNGWGFDEDIFFILKRYPNLRELELRYYADLITIEVIGLCCPLLEKLVTMNLGYFTPEHLAKCCPRLKAFDYKNDWFPHDFSTEKLSGLLQSFKNLTELNILGPISARAFDNLPLECRSSLKKLYFGTILDNALSIVCEYFQNLQTLELGCFDSDTSSQTYDLISKIQGLENLCIKDNSSIDDHKFVKLIKSCRKLKKLHLPYGPGLTDAGVSQLPNFGKNLRSLDVSYSKMSKKGCYSLSQLSLLNSLYLYGTEVDDTGIERILIGCPNLVSLSYGGGSLITVQTFLTAFDLRQRGLINPHLVLKHPRSKWRIADFKSGQEVIEMFEYH